MPNSKKPKVVMSDQIKEQIASDPALAEAMAEFNRIAVEAMQGVNDGRFPSFDVAMEFLTGSKPTPVRWDEGRQDYVDEKGRGTAQRDADDDKEPKAN